MRRLLLMLLAGMALVTSSWTSAAEEPAKSINFQFTDINGKRIQLSDYKGKWVLVNFWAPWCPLCWVEVPALNDLEKRPDFVVIGIGLDYGPDMNVVRDAAQSHDLNFTAIIAGGARRNPDSPFRQVGPVDFYPTSYLYDPNGEIVMFIPGQLKASKVLAFMEGWGAKKNSQVAASPAPDTPVGAAKPVAYEKGVAAPAKSQPAGKSSKTKATVTY